MFGILGIYIMVDYKIDNEIYVQLLYMGRIDWVFFFLVKIVQGFFFYVFCILVFEYVQYFVKCVLCKKLFLLIDILLKEV